MQIRDKEYGNLYPKTLADNVDLENGQTVQEFADDMNDRMPVDILLWEGSKVMNGEDVVTPSKKLSECFTGWGLAWRREGALQQKSFTFIPKAHIVLGGTGGGIRQIVAEQKSRGGIMNKYIYATDTQITGHSTNETGDDGNLGSIVLVGVYEM